MTSFANNARGILLSSITAGSTSITLGSGQGDLFPASDFYITLQEYSSGAIVFQEIAYCSSRSGDVLTVQRAQESCPRTDTATTQEATAYSFNSYVDADNGTIVSIYVTAGILTTILSDITGKLGVGGLRTTLSNAWKIFYSNGSNAEAELALGASGTYLTSNGASSAPSRGTPPLDVNGQTATTTLDRTNDYLPIYDASLGGTRKIKVSSIATTATTTAEGLVELATNAEATAGTDETRYINSKQVKDNYSVTTASISGTNSSASVNYPHGLGKTPTSVEFKAVGYIMTTVGHWTQSGQGCMYSQAGSGSTFGINTTYAIYCHKSSGTFATGLVTVDSTNVTIAWNYTGSEIDFVAIVTAQ